MKSICSAFAKVERTTCKETPEVATPLGIKIITIVFNPYCIL